MTTTDTPTTTTPAFDPAPLVARLTELAEAREHLDNETAAIKAELAAHLTFGRHQVGPIAVTVSPPARRFNLDTAATLLTPEQRELCTVTTLDAKKVKAQLPPVLLDECMDPGTGNPIVKVH